MPLREVSAYHEWVARDHPLAHAQSIVRLFIADIGDVSYRAPSVQDFELSEPPIYEVRYAFFPEAGGVRVEYIHWYDSDDVDLVYVG